MTLSHYIHSYKACWETGDGDQSAVLRSRGQTDHHNIG